MKKIAALFLTMIFVFALSACAETTDGLAGMALPNAQGQSETFAAGDLAPAKMAAAQAKEDGGVTNLLWSARETMRVGSEEAGPGQKENTEAVPTPTAPPAAEATLISREEAIAFALERAGLTSDAVRELEAELDRERNGIFWDVEFETKEYEYTYVLHAATGETVRSEKTPQRGTGGTNSETGRAPSSTPAPEPSAPAAQPSEKTGLISREEAIALALERAGLAKDAVWELEAELDRERNGIFWEVEFETREFEYSYDIDAETGTVVCCEKEKQD